MQYSKKIIFLCKQLFEETETKWFSRILKLTRHPVENWVLRQMERATQNTRTSSTIHIHAFCLTLLLSLLLCKLQNTELLYFLFRLISGQKHSGIKDINEPIVIAFYFLDKMPQIYSIISIEKKKYALFGNNLLRNKEISRNRYLLLIIPFKNTICEWLRINIQMILLAGSFFWSPTETSSFSPKSDTSNNPKLQKLTSSVHFCLVVGISYNFTVFSSSPWLSFSLWTIRVCWHDFGQYLCLKRLEFIEAYAMSSTFIGLFSNSVFSITLKAFKFLPL